MLVLSPVSDKDEEIRRIEGGGGDVGAAAEEVINETCSEFTINPEEFPEFADHANLLESFDFDDLFGDSLPDLAPDFSDHMNASSTVTTDKPHGDHKPVSATGSEHEVVSKKRKHSSASSKNHNDGKRKAKVDWTPELHRRFVQAVEQLGVDKAVPSRILDLMNIDCLTRHNVASHLQKYRAHRKHLLAREAEAANWTRKRHMYRGADVGGGARTNGWLAPAAAAAIGFPPPPLHHPQHFRPLHVWGHPTTVDQSTMWPKHIPPQPSAVAHPPFWAPLPPSDPPYWQRIPNGTTPTTPCFPATPTGFGGHRTVYKSDPGFGPLARPPLDLHPSKESVDAAIGDVLTKPWLPLPLGLKPPSVDSVMANLHRHGVSQVPPTTASCA